MMIYIIFIFALCFNMMIAGEYQVDQTKENVVKFISDAPLEDFEGVTNKIDGYIYWEGEELLKNSEMYFEVDLNSIDTGIGLRNRHMRDNYLETDKFPFTHFSGKLIKAEKNSDTIYQVSAQGTLFIHGVQKEITVEGKMSSINGIYRIKANFLLALSDYKVKIPQIMFYKIDENMKLELDFYVKKIDGQKLKGTHDEN